MGCGYVKVQCSIFNTSEHHDPVSGATGFELRGDFGVYVPQIVIRVLQSLIEIPIEKIQTIMRNCNLLSFTFHCCHYRSAVHSLIIVGFKCWLLFSKSYQRPQRPIKAVWPLVVFDCWARLRWWNSQHSLPEGRLRVIEEAVSRSAAPHNSSSNRTNWKEI